ncbi:MAG: DUF6498-containing protein [Planctomycetota bacterium]
MIVGADPPLPAPRNHSGLAILLSNGITIALAMAQNWDLRPLLALYWCQSVIIGGFNFLRMIRLRSFSTEGLSSNGQPVPETSKGKWSTAIFFAIHYGFFHLGYLVFIVAFTVGGEGKSTFGGPWQPDAYDWLWLGVGVAAFFAAHWFSFRKNVAADLAGRPNLGTMMFLPYARILPMHLTIIFGFWMGSNRGALLLFMLLKTGADFLMHVVEHRVMQKKAAGSG